MGYISIFLGLAVVVALMIRRWSPLMVGIVAATVVILMNRPAFWRIHDWHLLRRVLHHVHIPVPSDFFRKPSGADL